MIWTRDQILVLTFVDSVLKQLRSRHVNGGYVCSHVLMPDPSCPIKKEEQSSKTEQKEEGDSGTDPHSLVLEKRKEKNGFYACSFYDVTDTRTTVEIETKSVIWVIMVVVVKILS